MAQARIRSVKPEMWESERLGRRSALARLTFVGLISLADDEGRGRANRMFLFGRIHPYALDISPEQFASALEELGSLTDQERQAGKRPMVIFYQAAGDEFYFLPGWFDHQKIDRPSESTLPPPPGLELFPIQKTEKEPEKPKPWLQIRDIWNEIMRVPGHAPKLPLIQEVGSGRERHFKARWSEHPDPSYWAEVISMIPKSSFLLGDNPRRWRATIDWMLRPDSAAKILEGQYQDRGSPKAGAAAPVAGKYSRGSERAS